MLADKELANRIIAMTLDYAAQLDDSVADVAERCTPDELARYRQAVGKVMAEMLFELLNPLCLAHPELKPAQLYVPGCE